jgi:2,4-dienoyl-CoA reductase-like NADH-dependent reductase (Old Yellow Enzyme family)/thioredoxin reductase
MKYESIFKPGKIGTMELKNRLIVPAMETEYSQDGTINQRITDYWLARARGGWALLTMEVAAVSPEGKGFPNSLTLFNDSCIPMYRKLTDEVHKADAKIAIQLHHAGRQTISAFIGGERIVAPSAIAHPLYGEVPRELTTEECWRIISDYGDAAVRAKKAGFDTVEVHAGHGYLPVQFMSPNVNRRVDEFGGDLEGRTKFAVEIIKNIKEKCGADYPVMIRISSEEHLDDGLTLEDNIFIAQMLEEAGADALNISNGAALSAQYISGCMALRSGYNLGNSAAIRRAVEIPVIAVGKLNEPYIMNDTLAKGDVDFIAVGRGSIADPGMPNKLAEGRIDEITPCISCNQKCLPVPGVPNELGMSCLANPFVGREKEMVIREAEVGRNILVAGAGPAGLEFASVAAQRGHSVIVYEKESIGGQFALAAVPPTKQIIARLIKHYYAMCKKNGVEFVFDTLTKDTIKEKKPDVVVVATGGKSLVPKIEGVDGANVVTAHDILAGKAVSGQRALVIGGGSVGVETADFLAENQRSVTVVEMRDEVAIDEPDYSKIFLMERLRKYGVDLLTGSTVTRITSDGIVYNKDNKGHSLNGFDTIVLALGVRTYNTLSAEIEEMGIETYVIGDAEKAGDAVDAILAGAKLGIAI